MEVRSEIGVNGLYHAAESDLLPEGFAPFSDADAVPYSFVWVFLEVLPTNEERDIRMADFAAVIDATRPSVHPKDLAKFEKFAAEGR